MDIRHEVGGDMEIVLNMTDQHQLATHGRCLTASKVDDFTMRTEVIREEGICIPVVEVWGGDVTVYLPEQITFPLEAQVSEPLERNEAATRFLFGSTGKVSVVAQVQIG